MDRTVEHEKRKLCGSTALEITVADYIDGTYDDTDAHVIGVKDNSFLSVDFSDITYRFKQNQAIISGPSMVKLKKTSLLSASCFGSKKLAENVLKALEGLGAKTDQLRICKLSDYLRF